MKKLVAAVAGVALVVGTAVTVGGVAHAATPPGRTTPTLSPTTASFTVPAGATGTWLVRLWTLPNPGTLLGHASGTSGTLTVPVPTTATCDFQVDVRHTPAGSTASTWYSGLIATVPGCGRPIPPTCQLTGYSAGPPASIQVTVQAPDGLASVQVTQLIDATVDVPTFTPGDTAPLVITAAQIDPTEVSHLALEITDQDGTTLSCDPIGIHLAGGSSQTVTGVPARVHRAVIHNDGLRSVTLEVDGTPTVVALRPHQVATVDLGSSFTLVRGNTVTVSGTGSGSADVFLDQ